MGHCGDGLDRQTGRQKEKQRKIRKRLRERKKNDRQGGRDRRKRDREDGVRETREGREALRVKPGQGQEGAGVSWRGGGGRSRSQFPGQRTSALSISEGLGQ